MQHFVLQLFIFVILKINTDTFKNILYEIIRCIEIVIRQFSYHTLYQPETPVSARGLIWESRVDTRYDMKTDLNFHNLSNLFIIYFIVTKFVVVHIFRPTCTM